ncbi:MAG: hypothetical protein COU85_02600 [Candidatus Portnoybacteria bacterium CG10_big_fil_rev_8_21_14_0_10_44_7]|uniref:Uncharacterized protein n=1 Tax=Candidatus Portnoybacteria bacterium CG10_big_fil_rev_8_21_14_0_10_44_7 TaxID=1974816 RepID=A0A2M8KIA0_9BACT|nr:MAG: hypothetical protein COU85_02600 [Candidatus Portnoybacteria bacterium CG10_big_fil_rev_8_21_14_0_10_44_7]
MRIGIDGHSLEGQRTGVGRVLFNLLWQWAAEKQIEFFLYFKTEIPDDLPQTKNFHFRLTGQTSDFLFNQLTFPWVAKKDRCDWLFCPAYQIPLFSTKKRAVIIHDIIYRARPDWYNWHSFLEKIIYSYIFKKSARQARVIIVPSEATKKEIMRFYGVPSEKIKKCRWAADDSFQKQAISLAKQELIRRRYQIGGKFILTVGSLFYRRHPRDLIRAFARFARKNNYQLLIVGQDYSGQNIDGLIAAANKKLKCRAIVRQDHCRSDHDLAALYNLAQFFIYLSDYEGFGLPVLEAMRCGLPVITSAKSSLLEIAGRSAFLVKENSTAAILAALRQVAADSKLQTNLAVSGQKWAGEFSWAKASKCILQSLC